MPKNSNYEKSESLKKIERKIKKDMTLIRRKVLTVEMMRIGQVSREGAEKERLSAEKTIRPELIELLNELNSLIDESTEEINSLIDTLPR